MPKRKVSLREPSADALFLSKPKKSPPFPFVLDALAELDPFNRPTFGCLAVYVGEKIVLILRDKPTHTADNGVWIATTREQHDSLRLEFPNMRSVALLGEEITAWQVLPSDAPDFEEAAMHACELVLARDPRIGKVPKSKKKAPPRKGSR